MLNKGIAYKMSILQGEIDGYEKLIREIDDEEIREAKEELERMEDENEALRRANERLKKWLAENDKERENMPPVFDDSTLPVFTPAANTAAKGDPSGYVYEAVPDNYVEGATMTIFYKDPDTGEEIEWDGTEYDEKNNLLTDSHGVYGWDVPEGLWQVRFMKDGYETAYSEWMDVPPERTGVNFSAVSTLPPELISAINYDGEILLTFSRYMESSTLTADAVTVTADGKTIPCTVTPEREGKFSDTFLVQPVETDGFTAASLQVSLSESCTGYNKLPLEAVTVDVEVPQVISRLTVEASSVKDAVGEKAELRITAKPASLAAGKKLILRDSEGILAFEEAVFDANGEATVAFTPIVRGMTEITVGVADADVTAKVYVVSLNAAEITPQSASDAGKTDLPAAELGDVNGDGMVNASDAAQILIAAAAIGAGNDSGLTAEQEAVADVNGDGSINASDAATVLIYAAAIGAGQDVKLTDFVKS